MADDYQIGYGRPPKHTQFKKGESGNPNGRPKGTKNLTTDLLEELSEVVLIREGERSFRVSKQRALIKNLLARALKGDSRAASALLSLIFRALNLGDDGPDQTKPLTTEEQEVWDMLEARAQRRFAARADAAAVDTSKEEAP